MAALGGGGRVTKPDAVKGVPFFVGCGKQDFALASAKALHQALEQAKDEVAFLRGHGGGPPVVADRGSVSRRL